MVHHYKKVKPSSYGPDILPLAVQTVVEQGKSIRNTAKEYNIPYQTLRQHVLHPSKKIGRGLETVLTKMEEDQLAHALVFLSEWGGAPRTMHSQGRVLISNSF